ncbi:MAG: hypothetical protein LUE64_03640 [Candidatus Gastranaerophilales bacterium]|nr:hypothetical protein [Candidatus Gastranaerophilales bacterium]
MYIFELIYKIFYNIKHKKNTDTNVENEYENCDHIFVPVDSTKKVLACTKCGIIKKL